MDRNWQSSEYDICFVPYHQEVLHAHQSHFCLRVIAEDGGFQSDVSDIQTETEQICQAELRECGNCRACQRFPDVFCGLLHQDHVDCHHREKLLQEQKEHTLKTGMVTMIICIIVINVIMYIILS